MENVYTIEDPLYTKIKEYLDSKPWHEVNIAYHGFFESGTGEAGKDYYTEKSMQILYSYLSSRPRNEVKEIMELIRSCIKQFKVEHQDEEEINTDK